ncbi:hypothetical protein FHS26_006354 [Rhizobium pisi]|uniref:Uncharacterized protein n=2 Tax=Rhizobium TaxID=379 RepID=A0A7W6FN71_9HYPH|nr:MULTISPECIES: hypothetical protein [Rhizobium]MBB3138576.1 hypothetical protein [Rhizobium pisi]MBB3919714.1 hypothetical protein [Rhizobium fabae]
MVGISGHDSLLCPDSCLSIGLIEWNPIRCIDTAFAFQDHWNLLGRPECAN